MLQKYSFPRLKKKTNNKTNLSQIRQLAMFSFLDFIIVLFPLSYMGFVMVEFPEDTRFSERKRSRMDNQNLEANQGNSREEPRNDQNSYAYMRAWLTLRKSRRRGRKTRMMKAITRLLRLEEGILRLFCIGIEIWRILKETKRRARNYVKLRILSTSRLRKWEIGHVVKGSLKVRFQGLHPGEKGPRYARVVGGVHVFAERTETVIEEVLQHCGLDWGVDRRALVAAHALVLLSDELQRRELLLELRLLFLCRLCLTL